MDMPVYCGRSYFTAQTLHGEIERIKGALRKSIAVERPIPVALFRSVCLTVRSSTPAPRSGLVPSGFVGRPAVTGKDEFKEHSPMSTHGS